MTGLCWTVPLISVTLALFQVLHVVETRSTRNHSYPHNTHFHKCLIFIMPNCLYIHTCDNMHTHRRRSVTELRFVLRDYRNHTWWQNMLTSRGSRFMEELRRNICWKLSDKKEKYGNGCQTTTGRRGKISFLCWRRRGSRVRPLREDYGGFKKWPSNMDAKLSDPDRGAELIGCQGINEKPIKACKM